jgi:hypothetical protein
MSQRTPEPDATESYRLDDFFALALGRLAAERLTPENLARFREELVATCKQRGNGNELRAWNSILARGERAIREAFTESTESGRLLRAAVSFDAFINQDEQNVVRKKVELVVDGIRIDRLAMGSVNAWTKNAVSADEIATWIRDEFVGEARARVALMTFFLEVPLGIQVAFLGHHRINEAKALAFAQSIEPLGRTLPLQSRGQW